MAELPLVIIDVQRGGPSTGLPTKTGSRPTSCRPSTAATAKAPWPSWRPQRRRLLHHGLRSLPHSRRAHDARHPPQRRLHRQRLLGMAVPDADEYPRIKTNDIPADVLAAGWRPYMRTENLCATGPWPEPKAPHRLGGLERTPKQVPYPTTPSTTRRWCACATRK